MVNDEIKTSDLKHAVSYIEGMWKNLTRFREDDIGTLIGLPHPYIVPSGNSSSGFGFDEQYYWDSYFISQGLISTGEHKLAEGMLENLIYMFKRFDIIPNGSRYHFVSRSQPPILSSYIFDIFNIKQDKAWLTHCMSVAEREYFEVWTSVSHPNWRNVHQGLSRYYDINLIDGLAETESGWDTTTRFSDRSLSFLPIDLNAYLYKYEADFSKYYAMIGDRTTAKVWLDRADKRKKTINKLMWNPDKQIYFDYDYTMQKQSEVWSLAAYVPMWAGMVSPQRAEVLAAQLKMFRFDGGLAATRGSKHSDHTIEHRHQWSHPNGWAPLHWLVIQGLEKYGYSELARDIALQWLETNLEYFLQKGVFREAYNVVEPLSLPEPGLYPPQTGFGWTNAVFIYLANTYLADQMAEIRQGAADKAAQLKPIA